MSNKKPAGVNDIGLGLVSDSPQKGMFKDKEQSPSPLKKSVTFENEKASPAASPPKDVGEADSKLAPQVPEKPKKYKNFLVTIQKVECLYKGSYVGLDKQDPQVTIRFNNSLLETTQIDNNAMPYYQETFSFLVSEDDWNAWKDEKNDSEVPEHGQFTLQIEETDFKGKQEVKGQRTGTLRTMLGKQKTKGIQSLELYSTDTPANQKGGSDAASRAAAARVAIGWSVTDVTPASYLGNQQEGGAYKNCMPDDFRNNKGLLVATIHSVNEIGMKGSSTKYTVVAQLSDPENPNKKQEMSTNKNQLCQLDNFQGKSQKIYLSSKKILEQELSLFVCKEGQRKPVGVFRQPLSYALALVDGEDQTVMLDNFEAESSSFKGKDSSKATAVISLTYLNSIYTRKNGKGRMELTITSWTKAAQEGLNKTFAKVQLIGEKDEEIPVLKWDQTKDRKDAKDKGQLQQSEPISIDLPGGTLQKLVLTLFKQPEGLMAGLKSPTELAKVDLCIAELFGNAKIPQLAERFFANEKVDNKNEYLIKISYSANFDPSDATAEERALWARNATLGAGPERERSRVSQLTAETPQIVQKAALVEQKLSPFDYQGRDLFDLELPNAPLFTEQPKGVIVVKLQNMNLYWQDGVFKSLFMLVSTGKEIHRSKTVICNGSEGLHWGNEVLKMSTYDSADKLYFRIYDAAETSVVLAEGKLSLQMILVDTRAFQTTPAQVSFQVYESSWGLPLSSSDGDRSKLGQMSLGLMYRSSEHTLCPRGRLELSLTEATSVTNISVGRDVPECLPAVEFILNNQRVMVGGKLKDAGKDAKRNPKRLWDANKTYLDTFTSMDTLQINFYDDKDGSLLGCEYRDISALHLTPQTGIASRKKDKGAPKGSEHENTISIDLRRLPHMKGTITISCKYFPRKTPTQKLDTRLKLREAMLEALQKKWGDSAPKDFKKDACAAMQRPSSTVALNNQISYISIDLIQLKNIDARLALQLRHIVIEFTYGKNKYVSRCTLDLSQTRNQEILDHFFRVNLKDLSLRARDDPTFTVYDDHDIIVTAYSVTQNASKQELSQEGAEASNKLKIGQCRLESALLRQAQCTELKVCCGIGIPPEFYAGVEQTPGAGDEAYAKEETDALTNGPAKEAEEAEQFGDDELGLQASGLLSRMDQDLKSMQSMTRKAPQQQRAGPKDALILLKVSVFTAQSRIIRNPLGILSMSNFKLYNADTRMKEINFQSSQLVLNIVSNGIEHITGAAVQGQLQIDKVENKAGSPPDQKPTELYCLKGTDGKIMQSFLREGKAFYLKDDFEEVEEFNTELGGRGSRKMLKWPQPAMVNLFCSQALNDIEISLSIKQKDPQGQVILKKIARTELNLADVSLVMDGGSEKDTLNFAFELDYQVLEGGSSKASQSLLTGNRNLLGYSNADQTPATSYKNLLGHFYDSKLILTTQITFNSEIVKEARQLSQAIKSHPKTISVINNAFLMPQQVNYKDFIATGYDERLKKVTNKRKQEKAARIGAPGAETGMDSNQIKSTHVLVDLKMNKLESLLQNQAVVGAGNFGFVAYEPIYDINNAIISDYIEMVKQQVENQVSDFNSLKEERNVIIRKKIGSIVDSLIVQPQNLLPPEIQMSPVMAFGGHQSQIVNENLQCWVSSSVTKIVISFISQKGNNSQIHKFKEFLKNQPLMQTFNLLGIVKNYNNKLPQTTPDQPDQQIYISQAIIDIQGALDYEKKAPDASYMRAQTSSQINQRIALRNLDESIGDEASRRAKTPTSSLTTMVSRVQTSAFIDCPSGDVNVIFKRLSTNQQTIYSAQNCIRVKMVSPVPQDKVSIDVNDIVDTAELTQYSNKPTPEDNFQHILVNHVSNLVARHFSDKISIQVIQKSEDSNEKDPSAEKALFTSVIDLSKLPIKDGQVLSFTLIATGSQNIQTKQPVYYKIELDLMYKARDGTTGARDLLEQAKVNYKIIMGKDELTQIEIEILKMIIERHKLGAKLTNAMLRFRKVNFFLRRLSKIQYRTLDNKRQLRMMVSPLTFMFKVFSSSTFGKSYDHYRVLDLKQRVEQELLSCKPLDQSLKEALDRAKRSSGVENDDFINFKEGNLLQIDFPLDGIDLETYGIKSDSLKKLVFTIQTCQVGKSSKTVFTAEYNQKQLKTMKQAMKGQQIFIPNINLGIEIKFAIMVVPQSEIAVDGAQSKKAEVLRAHGPTGSLYLNEFEGKFKNNIPISTQIPLCKQKLTIDFRVVQNALTRQPHRVIEITFHRLMRLEETDFISKQEQDLEEFDFIKNHKIKESEASGKFKPNNTNLILSEKECVQNENEVITAEELAAQDAEDDEQKKDSTAAKGEQISKGSINDTIQKQSKKEADSTKYNLFIDFDTCEPFKGVHKGSHKIDINKFGKALGKNISRFDINNTSASNKIMFKVFRNDSRQSHRLREFGIGLEADKQSADKVEVGQLAEAEINLSHLNNFYINQPQGFVCPVKGTSAEDLDTKSHGYKVENVYALFSIKITDKTFGELILDLNEFRGIPACPAIEQLSWRVLIKPTIAGANAERLRKEAQEANLTADDLKRKKKSQKSELDSVGKTRIEPIFEQRSDPPIKYNMATMGGPQSRLTLTREMVIGIKMKDIFSNKSLFMRGGKELYQEFDQRIFIELLAATKMGPKTLVGQLELSLLDLIRKNMKMEDQKASELRRQKAKDEEEANKKDAKEEEQEEVSGKSQSLELEQAQRVEKAQRLKQRMIQHRQEMRELKKKVKSGQATEEDLKAKEDAFEAEQNAEHQEEAESKRRESEAAASNASKKGRSMQGSAMGSQKGSIYDEEDPNKDPIPEGFQNRVLPNSNNNLNEDEETDFKVGDLRPQEIHNKKHATRVVYNVGWKFSYMKREERSEAFYANLADLQELERTRERKKIPNMIDALYQFSGEFASSSAASARLNETMQVLSLVLASESANKTEGMEALENHQLLKNVKELLIAFSSVFIQFKQALQNGAKPGAKKVELPVVPSTVSLMRCCLYIKIICKNAAPKFLQKFQTSFAEAKLFIHIVEIFEQKAKTSHILATKTLNFITFMIYDVSSLYFETLSGVRLTPLIEFINNSEESKANAEIIACHSKFVNACCHCLFECQLEKEDLISDKGLLVKQDIKRLGSNIYELIKHLIAGGMNLQTKQDFEDIAKPLIDSSIRFIHLSISKFELLSQDEQDKKDNILSKVFEALFQLLVDGIASGLSLEFLDHVKKQMNYEITLINKLGVRRQLKLMFDGGDLQPRLKKLLDIFKENQDYNARMAQGLLDEDAEYRPDAEQYFTQIRQILDFFADDDAKNTLGENNTAQIQKMLSDPTLTNSSDFVLFLHSVVKADLDNEEEVEGENEQTRKQRIAKEKYGGMTNINKFSISHIEWLADEMPELIQL